MHRRFCVMGGVVGGRGRVRMHAGEGDAVEIVVPDSVRARAEDIVRLSRLLGGGGVAFRSSRDVRAPALVYGLGHMREGYSQGALRAEPHGEAPLGAGGSGGGRGAGFSSPTARGVEGGGGAP